MQNKSKNVHFNKTNTKDNKNIKEIPADFVEIIH